MYVSRSTIDFWFQKNKTDQGNPAVNVSAATNPRKEFISFVYLVHISIQCGGNMLNKSAFVCKGSRESFINQCLQKKLFSKAPGERYQVCMLWSEPNLQNNYSSALGHLCALERRFESITNLRGFINNQ